MRMQGCPPGCYCKSRRHPHGELVAWACASDRSRRRRSSRKYGALAPVFDHEARHQPAGSRPSSARGRQQGWKFAAILRAWILVTELDLIRIGSRLPSARARRPGERQSSTNRPHRCVEELRGAGCLVGLQRPMRCTCAGDSLRVPKNASSAGSFCCTPAPGFRRRGVGGGVGLKNGLAEWFLLTAISATSDSGR